MTLGTGWQPSDEFLDRVKRAYRLSIEGWRGAGRSMWTVIFERQRPVHEALLRSSNDALRSIFSNPGATDFFWGIDGLHYDATITLTNEDVSPICEALLAKVSLLTGENNFDFPNPFPQELGFSTQSGSASYRAIQAIYQAWMLKQLLPARSRQRRQIIEIGPGLGRTAYYAFRSGIDYTTVDLPLGVVAQACFLGATIGPDNLCFFDEAPRDGAIRLYPSSRPLPDEQFDIALNVDSMTEMSHRAAASYLSWIGEHSDRFLSINHTENDIQISTFCSRYLNIKQTKNSPYPIRDGYFVDLYDIGGTKPAFAPRYLFHRVSDSVRYRIGRRLDLARTKRSKPQAANC